MLNLQGIVSKKSGEKNRYKLQMTWTFEIHEKNKSNYGSFIHSPN